MPVYQIGLEDGRSLRIEADSQEAALAGVQHFQSQETAKEPSGVAAGLNKGTADLGNDLASTAKTYLGLGDGPAPEDPNYVPANVTNGSLNPLNWNYSQIPQKAAELAPGLAEQLAAAKAGATAGKAIGGVKGAALGALLASGATLWANSAGRAAKQDAVDRTGDQNAEPNTADKVRAGLTSAASAAVQSAFPVRAATAPAIKSVGTQGALDAIKKYLATTATAGAAGAAGNVVDQAGNTIGTDKGLRVDPGQAEDAALGNMAVAGSLGVPRLAAEAYTAGHQSVFGGPNEQASQAYFKRLQDNAGANGLGTATADYAAQENTKANLKRELQAVDDSNMSQDTANTLALARQGKTLTPDHVAAIEAADPAAGHLARQLYVAQQAQKFGSYDSSNQKWAGGLSGWADKYALRPFKAHLLIGGGSALVGAHMLGSYSIPTLAGAALGYGGARAVDNLTGLRSPAQSLSEKFAANVPTRLPTVTAPPPAPPPNNTGGGSGPAGPWGPRPMPTTSVPQVTPAAPAPAAPAPAPINPLALPRSITVPAKNLMAGARMAAKVRSVYDVATQKASGAAQAEALAADSHAINDQGGLAALSNPEFTKRGSQLLAAANVMRRLTAEPAGTPAAPVQTNGHAAPTTMNGVMNTVNAITAPAKISKKAGGEVKVEAPTQQASPEFDWNRVGGYDPSAIENPFAGKTPQEIARISADAMQGLPQLNKLSYYNRTLGTRTARDNVISELKQSFPGEQSIFDELRDGLHAPGNSDQAQSMRVIKHYTSLMSADAGTATRAAFRRADVRDAIWPPAKAKTSGKSKKAKEEGPSNSAT